MIDRSELKEKLSDIMDIDSSMLEDGRKLSELEEWDSMTRLSIIIMASEEYNVNIIGDELKSCETVSDLIGLFN